jgi:hypothetical protein
LYWTSLKNIPEWGVNMTEKEKGLAVETSRILGKDTKKMSLNDIIAELVTVIDTQEKMSKLLLLDK